MQKSISGIDRELEIPEIVFGEGHVSCVYKLYFDSQFYIGSTIDMNYRIFKHLRRVREGDHTKSVMDAFNKCKKIRLEIISEIINEVELRKFESEFILSNSGNELMLNMHSKTNTIRTEPLIANQYLDGVFIKKFESLSSIAKELGIKQPTWISASIKIGRKVHGFEFRILDSLGNEMEPKRSIRKQGERATVFVNKKGKIGKYSLSEELLGVYNSCAEAARSFKGEAKVIIKILEGKRKTHKGFTFKYEK